MKPQTPPTACVTERRQWLQSAVAMAACLAAPAWAQGRGSASGRLVVPFAPGGSTDVLARAIGQELTKAWGQSVVVENVPGAGGAIGADKVAKAAPDGYTLLMGHIGTLAVNPSLYPRLPYDALKDFASGLIFSKVDIVCNNVPDEQIVPLLEPLTRGANTAEIMDLFTHEQYFWPSYAAHRPDHFQRLETAIRFCTEHGYEPVFFHEGLLGGTE